MNAERGASPPTCYYCENGDDPARYHAGCRAEAARRVERGRCTFCNGPAMAGALGCDGCRGMGVPQYVGYSGGGLVW